MKIDSGDGPKIRRHGSKWKRGLILYDVGLELFPMLRPTRLVESALGG
jgi:hypothetical protein